MDDEDKLTEAREAYFQAFANEGPYLVGVGTNDLAAALLAAVNAGKPIPDDFDWYAGLPKGAVA